MAKLSPSPQKTRSPGGLAQLEEALRGGVAAFRQQVQLILALSQQNGKLPPLEAPAAPSMRAVRLMALLQVNSRPKEAHARRLLREVTQVEDLGVRLLLEARLALSMPPSVFKAALEDIWTQLPRLERPDARAEILFEIVPLLLLVDDEPAADSGLLELVAEAQRLRSVESRARGLTTLAPHLPREMALRALRRVLDELAEARNDALTGRTMSALTQYLPLELHEETLLLAEAIETPVERAHALTELVRCLGAEWQTRLRSSALKAVESIQAEDERAEALINFAPHLEAAREKQEYPAMLARALRLAVSRTRRQIRARVLVRRAPHLTSDLQGEALAAVNSLSSERERANLLAALAPTLPPNMLVASLAVAHNIREEDARTVALTALAQYAPHQARQQTMSDALAAATSLSNQFERVKALVELVGISADSQAQQPLHNALEITQQISNANARARALGVIAPLLNAETLPVAREIAEGMPDPQTRLSALLALIPRLSTEAQAEVQAQLFECVQQMPEEYKQARALIQIAPHVPQLLEQVEEMASRFSDAMDAVNVFLALLPQFKPEKRQHLVVKIWRGLHQIEEGYDQVTAIAALIPFLPKEVHGEVFRTALRALRRIDDEYDRASTLGLLAPLVSASSTDTPPLPDALTVVGMGLRATLRIPNQERRAPLLAQGAGLALNVASPDQAYQLWRSLAPLLAALPLADALLSLASLMPLIAHFAGEEGRATVADLLGLR